MNSKTGAEYIIDFLVSKGVDTVSGIPGGANLPIYDALQRSPVRHILARHEQAAGFIAQGMARTTGKPGVCLASSGPGVTNLATAIADAMMDSIPVMAITGQVPVSLIGTDAFQEVDAVGIMAPITKAAFMIRSIDELADRLEEAYHIMLKGRPGPVLIDVPKDIQQAMTSASTATPTALPAASSQGQPHMAELHDIVTLLHQAERPLIYAGGGVLHARATEELRALAEAFQIPVALTLMGRDILPASHPMNLGMLGMHGNRSTNRAIEEADLLLALGVRFDDRATGNVQAFARKAKIVHIDIDASEIGKNRPVHKGLCADLKEALPALLEAARAAVPSYASWHDWIRQQKAEEDQLLAEWLQNPFHPASLIRRIGKAAPTATIYTTDVGQHQMWAAQHLPLDRPRSFLTSGGAGTMGFGLPAAIGAALANPDSTVICITGDGSLFMNLAELSTAAELQLNIKVIVFNNGHLGLVRQQQNLFYQQNFFAIRYERPTDYAMVAKGMGFEAYNVSREDDINAILERVLAAKGPCLLNIPIDEKEHVWPMVPPGKANTEAIGPLASVK